MPKIQRINSLDEMRKWLQEKWGMDQPDSSDITNSVATLMETVKTIDTISDFNRERIKEWKALTDKLHKANDRKMCPKCEELLTTGCRCTQDLAQDIMESLFYREVKAI